MPRLHCAGSLSLLLTAIGCGGEAAIGAVVAPPAIIQLGVSPDSTSVPLGDLVEFSSIVIDAVGDTVTDLGSRNQSVTWVVIDTTPDLIASVSPDESVNGLTARVRGTQQGSAWVVASLALTTGTTLSDTAKLTVIEIRPQRF